MNISYSLPSKVTEVSFSFLTSDDVRRISVKQVINPVLLDNLNQPNFGGLYDPALGPSDRSDICTTCRLNYFTCPGHFGHIELPAPVFHPLFMMNMYNVLRGTCLFCHRFKISRTVLSKYIAKLQLLERGLLDAAQGVDDLHIRARRKGQSKKENDEEADPDKPTDETAQEYIMRIRLYVSVHLSRDSDNQGGHSKNTLVYQFRKELIAEFLKAIFLKKCQNDDCSSPAYTFRKEGYTKIIEYDLSQKQKQIQRRRRPNVLRGIKGTDFSDLRVVDGILDDDISEFEDEEEEKITQTLKEDTDDEIHRVKHNQSPRAANGRVKKKHGRNERVVAAEECRAHLRLLFSNESTICLLLYGRRGPLARVVNEGAPLASADMFFLDAIPIPPTRFRPPVRMNDVLFEHPQNELLAKILKTCYSLRDLNIELQSVSGRTAQSDEPLRLTLKSQLLESLVQLQVDVNSFMDSSKNPQPVRQGKLPPAGLKQILEKKEGLFRKHLMGKRVNYAARSVISPDVHIEPNEIGIPPIFAMTLTYPEPVIPANFHDLRRRVIVGSRSYPGASMIEYSDGRQQSLDTLSLEQRTAIANQLLTPEDESQCKKGLYTHSPAVNKKVYRHLRDGDIVLLNRQPTLHKPSMMAHKARVLSGEKTIRLHYANCNSYNADFDGDEMNIHFPQNQIARAEAMMIAHADNQYLVPTSGKPLRGLIQDHVVAGLWMTCQDTFFSREDYFQLLYGSLRPEESHSKLFTLSPAILRPNALWTGKQIISTVLKNITPDNMLGLNLHAKTKVPGHLWGSSSMEDQVVFMDGELLCGILDKAAFGASDYGIVHSVYELYGPEIAGQLLGIFSRLFTKFLQYKAFTCRTDDLTLNSAGEEKRAQLLEEAKDFGTDGAVENFPSLSKTSPDEIPRVLTGLLEDVLRDDNKMAGLDTTVKTKLSILTSSISDACLPRALWRKFPHNNMQAMTLSGAKGSAVNARQISCGLGQQELEGRRVPVMVSGKTLPSFRPFETRAIAGGYIASRFLTGIKPQEFYFHCMAGREGLIDTAVKTSRSGYLQRCLIKHLEGIRVHYDHTVRGSDSSIYQFYYGGDALDVTKLKHLYEFAFIARNELSLINQLKPAVVLGIVNEMMASSYMKKVLKRLTGSSRKGSRAKRDKYDTAMSKYNPSLFLGSTSEQFAAAVNDYVKSNPDRLLEVKGEERVFKSRKEPLLPSNFRLLMNIKYLRSLVEPGEAVGLLASQGVGEPSTQMTLNTFHFAGHGAANVTLGIPRLREIIMTASLKPKTPSMILNTRLGVSPQDVTIFCKHASRIKLSQVVDWVEIKQRIISVGQARRMQFTVVINFFSKKEYKSEYDIEPTNILAVFANRFPLALKKEIQSEMKKMDFDLRNQVLILGKSEKPTMQCNDAEQEVDEEVSIKKFRNVEEDSEVGDGDADEEKRTRQRTEMATYQDDNSDDGVVDVSSADAQEEPEFPPGPFEEEHNVDVANKPLVLQIIKIKEIFQRNLKNASAFAFTESSCVFELEFRMDIPKLLFVGIVEKTCQATIVREIPGITKCSQVQNDLIVNQSSAIKLFTDGSNLKGMWEFAVPFAECILENDEIYSNDIYAILKTYGVEMARAAILREIGVVFGAYNIQVDRRHLELIADYMTFEGGYKPFNRKGISTNPSPLLKASYETTATFVSEATLFGDLDELSAPSGSIILGQPIKTGTGVFDILSPIAI